jgi:hypothetical protein
MITCHRASHFGRLKSGHNRSYRVIHGYHLRAWWQAAAFLIVVRVFGLAGFAFVLAAVIARPSRNITLRIGALGTRVLAGERSEEYSA